MKNVSIVIVSMLIVLLVLPGETNAQKWLKKKGETEADTSESKTTGIMSAKKFLEKKSVSELYQEIGSQMDTILIKRTYLEKNYGEKMVAYEKASAEMKQLEMDMGKKSDPYKAAAKEFKGLKKANADFEKQTDLYEEEIIKLDGLVESLTKTMEAEFKEDYVEKYHNYVEKRPESRTIELNPSFWSLVVQDPAKLKTLQTLVSLNSLLYESSTLYADAYFNNDTEKAFLTRMDAAWETELADLKTKEATPEEIDQKRVAFIKNAKSSDEFIAIMKQKQDSRQAMKEQLKETSYNALSLTLKELLDANNIQSVQRPDTVNAKDFLTIVKEEGENAKCVLDMLLKTSQGSALVGRQAVKSSVVELKTKNTSKKNKTFVMMNGDIKILVLKEGTEIRYQITNEYLDGKGESLGVNLADSDESVSMALAESEDNMAIVLNQEMSLDDMNPVIVGETAESK
jgi:hypothetical protein